MPTHTEIHQRAALLCRVMTATSSASTALAWWVDEGRPLTIEVLSWRVRQLLATEYTALDGRHLTQAVERIGMLRSPRSGRVVALTTALLLPRRLPRSVRLAIGTFDPEDDREPTRPTATPLGAALATHHIEMGREQPVARTIWGSLDAAGEPLAVRCSAVLTVQGRPAALVTEEVTLTMLAEFAPPPELVAAFPAVQGQVEPTHCPCSAHSPASPFRTSTLPT